MRLLLTVIFISTIHLLTANAQESAWADGFGINQPWAPGVVIGRTITHDNKLYITGNFLTANGDKGTGSIAWWDGAEWHGIDRPENLEAIYGITFMGDDMYLGGYFASSNSMGQPLNRVARYDGTTWHPLGSGVNDVVWWMINDGSSVYLAGDFTTAGDSVVNRITRWDGEKFHKYGDGVNNKVDQIVLFENELYISGSFTDAGGDPDADYIAKWNGSQWVTVGNGLSNIVSRMVVFQDTLYVAGNFNQSGSAESLPYIAKLVNDEWKPIILDAGLTVRQAPVMTVYENALYFGGEFRKSGNYFGLASFNGTNWTTYQPTPTGNKWDMTIYNGHIITSGYNWWQSGTQDPDLFLPIQIMVIGYDPVAQKSYNLRQLNRPNLGIDQQVASIVKWKNQILVGGYFTGAGGNRELNGIARWNGSNWAHVPGLDFTEFAQVASLRVFDDELWVQTRSQNLFGRPEVDYLFKVVNDSIMPVVPNLPAYPNDYLVHNGVIYMAANGYIFNPSEYFIGVIAIEDGEIRQVGPKLNNTATDIEIYNDSLFVSGFFTDAGGADSIDYLAKIGLNDSTFHFVAKVNNYINNMLVWSPPAIMANTKQSAGNSTLWIAGSFSHVNNDPEFGRIFGYSSGEIEKLGFGLSGIYANPIIAGSDSEGFYVGGIYNVPADITSKGIAKYNGKAWISYEPGIEGTVYATIMSGDTLYIGGYFQEAGGKTAFNFTYFTGEGKQAVSVEEDQTRSGLPEEFTLDQNYPNPFNPSTTIRFSVPESGLVNLSVFNILGQKVGELVNKTMKQGNYTVSFNGNGLSSGVYFYTITSGQKTITKKMTLLK